MCVLAAGLLWLPGCTGLEPAALGVAASAGQTAAGILGKGRFNSAHAKPMDEVIAAARSELLHLGLTLTHDEPDGPRGWFLRGEDAHDEWVRITIESRSLKLTRMQINVGWWGYEPTARLVYQGIELRLGGPVLDALKTLPLTKTATTAAATQPATSTAPSP